MNNRIRTLILGGGLSGLSAAFHLKRDYLLIEKEAEVGGLCRTTQTNGFLFDMTGHWLHFRNPYIEGWIKDLLENNITRIQREARIYSKRTFTHYPFQSNVYGLPPEVVKECLLGIIDARESQKERKDPTNFKEYILYHFGTGIAKHFMIPYNKKLFRTSLNHLSAHWCERFIPKPDLESIIAGAVGCSPEILGYNATFYYPKSGGIGELPKAIARELPEIHLNTQPLFIDNKERLVVSSFAEIPYEHLVSTIPLPELLKKLTYIPEQIKFAARQLRWISVDYVNIGIRGKLNHGYHWLYIPEDRFAFYRIGYYSNAVPSMAPDGCSSIFIEFSRNNKDVVNREFLMAGIKEALNEIEGFASERGILFIEHRTIPYGYVIFNHNYLEAMSKIKNFLQTQGIHLCGRYGAWEYMSMEDSLIDGKHTAEKILKRKRSL